ncbi:type II toxin-antitoxin system VapC family toxin [Candidimonas sp. SYP-B2681]|uniref:type II toxin-antitoxin system VapC family toxin n=1 Tax=Candidimonas sp. SYP-B2681 TaxID=2497686 RepID=UPI000F88F1D1|nr:type II toxin-antitoxin system VapC family toxin [Candidimonas sp. SYP-B2681]RTZ43397.1 type II toxin-antitoxin system VapC family toxin [Candidimonas sp. SYP-B2681]
MNGVLVDTSVWVDHFRREIQGLVYLLERDRVMVHPMVLGELACETPPNRAPILVDLDSLRNTQQATLKETLDFVESEELFGLGCGLVDMLLLASTMMSPQTELWTLDKRLSASAERFGVMHRPQAH